MGIWETRVRQWAWNLSFFSILWLRLFGDESVVDPLKQLVKESWNEVAGDSEHFYEIKNNYKLIRSQMKLLKLSLVASVLIIANL